MSKNKLYGAILGDLAGQPYELPAMRGDYSNPVIHNPVSVFTDDTLMTLATAKALLNGTSFEDEYKEMGKRYPGDHYGKGFKAWLQTEAGTINDSFGNGCLMRLSPINKPRLPSQPAGGHRRVLGGHYFFLIKFIIKKIYKWKKYSKFLR